MQFLLLLCYVAKGTNNKSSIETAVIGYKLLLQQCREENAKKTVHIGQNVGMVKTRNDNEQYLTSVKTPRHCKMMMVVWNKKITPELVFLVVGKALPSPSEKR